MFFLVAMLFVSSSNSYMQPSGRGPFLLQYQRRYQFGKTRSRRGSELRVLSLPNLDDVATNSTDTSAASGAVSSEQQPTEQQSQQQSSVVDTAPCLDSVCSSDPSSVVSTREAAETAANEVGGAIERLGSLTGPTVWSEFGRIAHEKTSDNNDDGTFANLGQGFPDWLPPKFCVDCLVEAATDSAQRSPHQYTRTAGHPSLVKQLASRYSTHLNRNIDAFSEIAVTVGASQALYLSLQSIIKPGDEVILFEPFFDLYVKQVQLAGGTPIFVPLTFVPYDLNDATSGGEWVLEEDNLKRAMTPRTRGLILNSPHNPTGKVFTRSEMEMIAKLVVESGDRCIVLSDEVYKYIIHAPPKEDDTVNGNNVNGHGVNGNHATNGEFNGKSSSASVAASAVLCPGHVHFAFLPGMWDRTITISSAGKTFSATGWQVGWCVGPDHLIHMIHELLPYVQFCASTVIQEALARALPLTDQPYEGYDSYYEYLKSKYTRKRDLLANALKQAGFAIPNYDVTPGGGFFIFARIGPEIASAIPSDRLMAQNPAAPGGFARRDWALCQWMAEELGLLCIPSSPFFSAESAARGASDDFIRIAFCKRDETIEAAANALKKLT